MPEGGSSRNDCTTMRAACSIRVSCISSTLADGVTTATSPCRSMRNVCSCVASEDMTVLLLVVKRMVAAACHRTAAYHLAALLSTSLRGGERTGFSVVAQLVLAKPRLSEVVV